MVNTTLIKTANVQEDIRNVSYDDYYNMNQSIYYTLDDKKHHVSVIIFITVIIFSLIGNILVVVYNNVFCMRLRSLTNIFIFNLALSDLLFTVGLVFQIIRRIRGLIMSKSLCKVSIVLHSAGFYSSIMFLVLMSVQRYINVVHPHTGWKEGRWITHILICAWMISILAALPVTVHNVAYPDSGGCTYNQTAVIVTMYKRSTIFVCAFLFMAFCYIRILQTIFKSPTNQKHRTTGLTFLLVATFCICWAPYNIVMFLDTLPYYSVTSSNHLKNTIYICWILASSRCCLNPVIYGFFGLIFCKTEREILQRRANFNF